MKIIKRGSEDKKMHFIVFILFTAFIFHFSYWIISDVFKPFVSYDSLVTIKGVVDSYKYRYKDHDFDIFLTDGRKVIFSFISANKSFREKVKKGMEMTFKVEKSKKEGEYFGREAIYKGNTLFSFQDYKDSVKKGHFYIPFLVVFFLVIWFFCVLLPGLGYKAVFEENVPKEDKNQSSNDTTDI